MTEKYPITVDEVRDAQDHFKNGSIQHESKNFKEAIEAFKKTISIHPFDENHLDEFEKKLKAGNFKLQQESIGYMGCAAVHLNEMIHGLDEDQKEEVPVDESLINTFIACKPLFLESNLETENLLYPNPTSDMIHIYSDEKPSN